MHTFDWCLIAYVPFNCIDTGCKRKREEEEEKDEREPSWVIPLYKSRLDDLEGSKGVAKRWAMEYLCTINKQFDYCERCEALIPAVLVRCVMEKDVPYEGRMENLCFTCRYREVARKRASCDTKAHRTKHCMCLPEPCAPAPECKYCRMAKLTMNQVLAYPDFNGKGFRGALARAAKRRFNSSSSSSSSV